MVSSIHLSIRPTPTPPQLHPVSSYSLPSPRFGESFLALFINAGSERHKELGSHFFSAFSCLMKNRTELALEECPHLPCLHTYFPKRDLFTRGTQVQRNLDYPSLQSPQCGDAASRGRGRQRLSRLLCGVRAACLGCFPDSGVGEHLQVLLPVHI